MKPLLLALLAAGAAGPGPTDDRARATVRQRFEQAGRPAPNFDAALNQAARALALATLDSSAEAASGLLEITQAISQAGGWDANPRAIFVKASPDAVLEALSTHPGLTEEHAGVVGVGTALREGAAAACVLLAERRLALRPTARQHASAGARDRVCFELEAPLAGAQLYVTRPGGGVDALPVSARGRALCSEVGYPEAGRHTVEVLARGPAGPEVAALFFVDVGPRARREGEAMAEVASFDEARAALLARINALRASRQAPPVRLVPALDAVAQAWAQRLASEGFFAHVGPDGSTLAARLAAGGYRYATAGENLGQASGPMAAHFGIEHSPGHRANVLDASHRELGLGLARRGDTVILVEVLASPRAGLPADVRGAVYAKVASVREERGLPALRRSAQLEALAQAHAERAWQAQVASAQVPGPDGGGLHDRVFRALPGATSAAVDVAVTDSVDRVGDSRNAVDSRHGLVGVGTVRGDSPAWGADAVLAVIVYASEQPR